jgi:hypothetical protein
MSITFKVDESSKANVIETWSQVAFRDSKEVEEPVKKITMTIEAGDVVIVDVERFVMGGHHTLNEKGEGVPLTKTNRYLLSKVDADVVLLLRRTV